MNDLAEIAEVARALCGGAVGNLEEVGGAGNHRVYRVDGRNGNRFALKTYYAGGYEGCERLNAEFGGLSYLWQGGVRAIPQPMAADRDARCALFGWIDGEPVRKPSMADVETASAFVRDLHELAHQDDGTAVLPLAREACLSPDELFRQINARRSRLTREGAFRSDLAAFLRDRFDDTLSVAWARVRDGLAQAGIAHDKNLPDIYRTLSPSDFGFHNAVRNTDGRLVFCDFEYFGWDDPVKLVADFVLHPGMQLSAAKAVRFEQNAAAIFADDPFFTTRFALLRPLYALRWAMIVLNEFLPEKWAQRAYAKGEGDRSEILRTQLGKADAFVTRVNKELSA